MVSGLSLPLSLTLNLICVWVCGIVVRWWWWGWWWCELLPWPPGTTIHQTSPMASLEAGKAPNPPSHHLYLTSQLCSV